MKRKVVSKLKLSIGAYIFGRYFGGPFSKRSCSTNLPRRCENVKTPPQCNEIKVQCPITVLCRKRINNQQSNNSCNETLIKGQRGTIKI